MVVISPDEEMEPTQFKQLEDEKVAQEIGPTKADMEESSNRSLKASVSDSDNRSECSEIDVVGIDEEIPVVNKCRN